MMEWWRMTPVVAQDWLLLAAWLAPAAIVGVAVTRGYRVAPLTRALLWRFRGTNALFATLVAVSVGIGAGLLAQERALRVATARAADRFDVIVAAPGDQVRMLLAAVYLQPSDAPLLRGDVIERLQSDPQIDLVSPLAFGDSYRGAPVVGATAAFVAHLSGPMAEGRVFETIDEAVVGALSDLSVGDAFTPIHGQGDFQDGAHEGVALRVTGRMAPTGSPWDRAVVTPVESVWAVHGLAIGHPPGAGDRIGPPFDAEYFPGAPAFVLHSEVLWRNYSIRARYNDDASMAFFPGLVLARLLSVLGDVREMMSLMAVLTQVLVAAGVLVGLVALARLFARRFALLRALGAPRRFVFALIWSYAAALLGAGCLLGVGVAWGASQAISAIVTARTDIAVAPALSVTDLHVVAAFFSLTTVLALTPALLAYRQSVVDDLRQG